MSIAASSNQMHVAGGDLGNLMWITNDVWQMCMYEYNASCFLQLVRMFYICTSFHFLSPFHTSPPARPYCPRPPSGQSCICRPSYGPVRFLVFPYGVVSLPI